MASLQQLDGNSVKIGLAKNDKTYGFMFGLLESMKERMSIKEYSIKYSTLE